MVGFQSGLKGLDSGVVQWGRGCCSQALVITAKVIEDMPCKNYKETSCEIILLRKYIALSHHNN